MVQWKRCLPSSLKILSLIPQNPNEGRRKSTPMSFLLTSTCRLACIGTYFLYVCF